MRLSRKTRILAGVSVTTIVLLVLLYTADLKPSLEMIGRANPWLLVPAVISANVPILIYAFIWSRVFRISGIDMKYSSSIRVVLSNTFVNNLTPFGNIGGEAVVTYIISKTNGDDAGKVFSATLASSLLNFIPITTLLFLGALIEGYWLVLAVLPVAACSILAYTRIGTFPEIPFRHKINGKMPDSFLKFGKDFKQASDILRSSKREMISLAILNHLWPIFDILSILLIGFSLGLDLLTPSIILVVPLARIAGYMPTPGGTGPYEIALTGLLSYFTGITIPEAVIVAVIYRASTYYIGVIAGYFALNSLQLRKTI